MRKIPNKYYLKNSPGYLAFKISNFYQIKLFIKVNSSSYLLNHQISLVILRKMFSLSDLIAKY
jgi:ABC-type bacteriocin/lantibiotic exporter with double-glycine peptidase domain